MAFVAKSSPQCPEMNGWLLLIKMTQSKQPREDYFGGYHWAASLDFGYLFWNKYGRVCYFLIYIILQLSTSKDKGMLQFSLALIKGDLFK